MLMASPFLHVCWNAMQMPHLRSAWGLRKTSVPSAHKECTFCPCVHKLGNNMCKWVLSHVIAQFGGAYAHLLVLVLHKKLWHASYDFS